MDAAQGALFGGFPRAVGVTTPESDGMELRQYLVHSRTEFDGVLDCVSGDRNLYASLSSYQPIRNGEGFGGCAVVADKVSFDFDSTAKADPDDYPSLDPDEKPRWDHSLIPSDSPDYVVADWMVQDSDVREAVLGPICDDVTRLATASMEADIPVLGVFSGFGVHLHQLYEPTANRPGDKMNSTCRKWVTELSLATADGQASGKPYRIMRVPNVERVAHTDDGTIGTGLNLIPLRGSELSSIRPKDLVDLSTSPRPSIGIDADSRPTLKVRGDYLGPSYDDGIGQEKMRPVPDRGSCDGFAKELVKRVTKMPCVYERALTRDPPNDVRVKLGIMFLIAGFSPDEIADIIARLGWVDFDREKTVYQLEKLRQSGKGDWSCRTMMGKGLCTRADEPKQCPAYGYQGGGTP